MALITQLKAKAAKKVQEEAAAAAAAKEATVAAAVREPPAPATSADAAPSAPTSGAACPPTQRARGALPAPVIQQLAGDFTFQPSAAARKPLAPAPASASALLAIYTLFCAMLHWGPSAPFV